MSVKYYCRTSCSGKVKVLGTVRCLYCTPLRRGACLRNIVQVLLIMTAHFRDYTCHISISRLEGLSWTWSSSVFRNVDNF